MSHLQVLSSTVESFHNKENTTSSTNEVKDASFEHNVKPKVEEVMDYKVIEGQRWYLCKFQGYPETPNAWHSYSVLECDALIDEYHANHGKSSPKPQPVEIESTKKNLETVKEALRSLGGKAFGGAIVDWICDNGMEMVNTYSGDRKKLRYCVNGLLSARVNASIFEKKVYKENGTTKTEWMLTDSHRGDGANQNLTHLKEKVSSENKHTDTNTPTDDSERESMDDDNAADHARTHTATPEDDDNNSTHSTYNTRNATRPIRTRSGSSLNVNNGTSELNNPYARSSSSRPQRERKKVIAVPFKEPVFDMEKEEFFESSTSIGLLDGTLMDDRINPVGPIDEDPFLAEGGHDGVSSGTPQTYRGMIKIALESMSGMATFEAISKYIGTRFRDQLINKADTWKHSIAGCLSVYFARKEQKDPSGKVIWTLGEPPKPKRRGRKRERDDSTGSPSYERNDITPSSSRELPPNHPSYTYCESYVVPHTSKRKKDEMISVSADHLESLEEENQCLKLIVAKKQREDRMMDYHISNANATNGAPSKPHQIASSTAAGNINDNRTCVSCNERKELTMMANPCGHLFCGSIFCDQSTSNRCAICNAVITGKIPFRGNRLPAKTPSPSTSATSAPSSSSSSSTVIIKDTTTLTQSSSLTSLSSVADMMDDDKKESKDILNNLSKLNAEANSNL